MEPPRSILPVQAPIKKQRRAQRKVLRALLLILYWLLQWTWGIIQNLVGLTAFIVVGRGRARGYHGAAVRSWNLSGSMTLGMFILMDRGHGPDILAHEWGHTIQSIILGPLYLLAVGLPSIIWAGLPAFDRYRSRNNVSYDRLYCEGWATRLGRRTLTSPRPASSTSGTHAANNVTSTSGSRP